MLSWHSEAFASGHFEAAERPKNLAQSPKVNNLSEATLSLPSDPDMKIIQQLPLVIASEAWQSHQIASA